jgi:hypothetical protein
MFIPIIIVYAGIGAIFGGTQLSAIHKMGKIGVFDKTGKPLGSREITLADDLKVMAVSTTLWPLLIVGRPV